MFEGLSEYLTGLYNQSGFLLNTESDRSSEALEEIVVDDSASNAGPGLATSSSQQLPRVELIRLLADVSGLVRENSQFTQYLNYVYRLCKGSQPVVMEVLSDDRSNELNCC